MTFWSDRYLYNVRSERYLYISGSEESDFWETDTCTMLGVKDVYQ